MSSHISQVSLYVNSVGMSLPDTIQTLTEAGHREDEHARGQRGLHLLSVSDCCHKWLHSTISLSSVSDSKVERQPKPAGAARKSDSWRAVRLTPTPGTPLNHHRRRCAGWEFPPYIQFFHLLGKCWNVDLEPICNFHALIVHAFFPKVVCQIRAPLFGFL